MAKLSIKPKHDTTDILHIYEDGSRVITRNEPVKNALKDLGENFYIDKKEKEFDLVPAMGGDRKYRSADFEIEGDMPDENTAFWQLAETFVSKKNDPKETKNENSPRKPAKRN